MTDQEEFHLKMAAGAMYSGNSYLGLHSTMLMHMIGGADTVMWSMLVDLLTLI